jgi:hypothetical protein
MVPEFIEMFKRAKPQMEAAFRAKHPEGYKEIMIEICRHLGAQNGEYGMPDPGVVHEIDDGDYQGTLIYVIAEKAYQPSSYWTARVSYGSCSACDTLQSICGYGDDPPNEDQVKDYMTLALHMVESMCPVGGE